MYGSAAYVVDNSSISISDSAVLSNTAVAGGGVDCEDHTSLNISSSLFQGNKDDTGGAISADGYCKVGLMPARNCITKLYAAYDHEQSIVALCIALCVTVTSRSVVVLRVPSSHAPMGPPI
jgi:hypothetical protein